MKNPSGSNQELIDEISVLRRRIKELEQSESGRKRAEEALRFSERQLKSYIESEEKFCKAFHSSPILTAISTIEEGRFLDVNEIFLQTLLFSREEVIGKTSLELGLFANPAQRKVIRKIMEEKGYPKNIEAQMVARNGQIIDGLFSAEPITINNEKCWLTVMVDVTEQKRVAEALKESEEKYRRITENMSDIVAEVDARGIIRYASPSHGKILGDNPEGLIGRSVFEGVHPEDRDRVAAEYMEGVRTKTDREVEYRYRHSDGHYTWLRSSGHSLYGISGELVGIIINSSDITKRRRAEEELQAGKAQLSNALEIAHLGHWEYDVANDLFTFNDHFYKMFRTTVEQVGGYTMQSAEYAHRFVHPDDMHMVGEETRKAIETTDPHFNRQIEHRILYADGTEGYITVRFFIIKGSHGRTVKTYGVNQDITERKKREAELHITLEKYRVLFDSFPLGISITDKDGNIVESNRESERLLNVSKQEQTMRKHDSPEWQIIHPDGTPMQTDEFASVRALKENRRIENVQMGVVKGSEGVTWINVTAAPIPLDNFGVAITYGDITDQKAIEEALRISEEQYRQLFENMTEGVAVHELIYNDDGHAVDYRLMDANRAYSKHTGISAESSKGLPATILYGTTSPPYLKEYEIVARTGEPMAFETFFPPMAKHFRIAVISPKRGFFATVFEDITERKRLEKDRIMLGERLQRSEKMEALGTLAGGVAHDLNNVLGIIVGYSEMVLEGVDKSSPQRRSLENVMNGGLKAAAIVEDLLTLARRGVQGRSILNLNKIVADCQQSPELAKLSGHHPSVKIQTNIEPDLLNISGSSIHLGKSIYNLISNASEAMPKGGAVTIKTTNQYLDKPIQGYDQIQTGDYVVLSVSDTGEGISANDLKRIFEPFYTKKIMGRSGTGLGLAVVWGTVKDHNGYINVQSEEGKGSTFTLYFPVTREETTTEAVAVPTSEYMGKGESILVVDDVKEQRDLASSILRTLNYNVSSVACGEDAVAYVKKSGVDLMVLDMILDPGMDGLDTYNQVLEIRPNQKAIVVSGFSESERVKKARDLGVGAYLRKPYIKENLGMAVRKELDRK
jgi:two-component system cell cycle sensor histidine kinase/response regulator CckA